MASKIATSGEWFRKPNAAEQAWRDLLSATSPTVFQIRERMARGFKAREAMDYVLGDGAYEQFAREVWLACRGEAWTRQ